MKKTIRFLLCVAACITFAFAVACADAGASTPPEVPSSGQQSSETGGDNSTSDSGESDENGGAGETGGNGGVVTPIKPGGNYEVGDDYG